MEAAGAAGLTDLMATVARGCVEQSAGGGLHIFLRVSDGPAKPNTKLAHAGTGPNRHVVAETRGEGGFVIVAPTPGRKGHPEGASYLFLQGSSPDGTPTITADPVPLRIVSRILTQDANGNYPCPECQRVFRNGIRQAEGADYNTNPGGILPIHRWADDDVILGEWIGTEQPAPASGPPTAANFEQIRNWQQVSPDELLPPGDTRRRSGLALSQIRDGDYHPDRLTYRSCLFWYERRIQARSQAPPLTINCRAATQDWAAWMAER
jgi:hypothetical protein